MKVPLLDLRPHYESMREELNAALLEVAESTMYIMGPKVTALEEAVAEYTGTKHAIGVSSGTDALLLALMALDVGHDDYVITTPFTFFATVGVVARLGAHPLFVDIDPVSFNIDPGALKTMLDGLSPEKRAKVKAIIPVHLYGQSAPMDEINTIAQAHGISVIEDAAQAIGSEYPGKDGNKRAGAMGDMGCFSFFPSKNLGAMGDGGMITTNDDKLLETLRIKRVHGGEPKYYHKVIGGNFRLDPMQAAVLLVKLPHLESWHAGRRKNAELYTSLLAEKGIEQVRPPAAVFKDSGATNYHIYNQFVIRAEQRDDLRKHLLDNEIVTDIYYPVPLHEQECFQYLGHKAGEFPQSETAAKETLALPIYPDLTPDMIEYVVEQIAAFYKA